jgi:quinol monooxygenase YgiN
MIFEVADLRIHPGQNEAFDAAITRGVSEVIAKSEGFLGYSVKKGIESPERYVLTSQWASIEAHMVGFREGPLFPQWRAIVGPFFAAPPTVEHFSLVSGTPA